MSEVPDLPEVEPGLTTLLAVPRRSGPASPATVAFKAGEVKVKMLCTGGTLELRLEPVTNYTIQCKVGEVTPVMNVIHAGSAKDAVSVQVVTGPGVVWNLRIEQ